MAESPYLDFIPSNLQKGEVQTVQKYESDSSLKLDKGLQYSYSIDHSTGTFSSADAEGAFILPWFLSQSTQNNQHIVKATHLSAINLSQNRAHYPVTGLGNRGIRGFTKGQKMVAGSLIFSGSAGGAFSETFKKYQQWNGFSDFEAQFTSPHELPPIDLIVSMVNERGNSLMLIIKQMVFVDSGQSIDVNNPPLNEAYSFMAANASHFYTPIK